MDGQPEKRMAENYEITQVVQIGHKEVVMGMDETNAMPYFCAIYSENEICGSYSGCMVSDDYVEIVEIFAERVREQCEKVREEQEKITVPREPITADMCLSLAYDTSPVGCTKAGISLCTRPACLCYRGKWGKGESSWKCLYMHKSLQWKIKQMGKAGYAGGG